MIYGTTPADVVTDRSGNVLAGRALTVWTAIDGTRLPALYDLDGVLVGDTLMTDANGRYAFQLMDADYPVLALRDPDGGWWETFAASAVRQSISDATQAKVSATDAQNAANRAETAATAAQSAVGEISRSLSQFATEAQLTGTADAGPAMQKLINSLPKGGRAIMPPGCRLWYSGATTTELTGRDGLTIDLAGSTIFKTSTAGYYNIFNVNGNGTGYGSGVKDLTIQNGYLEGSFSDSSVASVCLFQANHAQNVLIKGCTFVACQTGAGHVIDLGGCDKITIEDCRWYGFRFTTQTPRTETVQIDISRKGSGAGSAGNWDGLLCRSIHMTRCQFLPYVDGVGKKWPAPNPLGAHSSREGRYYEDISATKILVIDPCVDPAETAVQSDDAYIRGLFHFTAIKGLRIQARVHATDGQGSIRVCMITSTSVGDLAANDPNTDTTQGPYAKPVIAEDIDLDLKVTGMRGTVSVLNPLVCVTGVSNNGLARDVRVRISTDGAHKEAVYFNKVEKSMIEMTDVSDVETGARVLNGNGVKVSGNIRNITYPVRFDNSYRCAVTSLTGETATSTPRVISVTNGADSITASNVNLSGYTQLWAPTPPPNRAEAAILPTSLLPTPA